VLAVAAGGAAAAAGVRTPPPTRRAYHNYTMRLEFSDGSLQQKIGFFSIQAL
jgi:hypothetical protein